MGVRSPVLQCRHVCVRFDHSTAVSDMSISIGAGDLVGLVGPTGAGKTSFLRAAAGLLAIQGGAISVLGNPLVSNGTVRPNDIGFAAQIPEFNGRLTVREVLEHAALAAGLNSYEAELRVDDWLEKTHLTGMATQKIRPLSAALRQRLAIARALLLDPPLILLDEPATTLDPASRMRLRQLLCRLRDQGKAIIVSSRSLTYINEYCTHVAIMNRGRLVAYGTVDRTQVIVTMPMRFRISLSRPISGLSALVSDFGGASLIAQDYPNYTLECRDQSVEPAGLLEHLVRHNVPVSSFVQLN